MREKISRLSTSTVTEIAFHADEKGTIDARDLMITQGDIVFLLRVGTPKYIVQILQYNKSQSDPGLRVSDNVFPINDVSELNSLIEVISTIPPQNLAPYVELIEPTEDE